MRKTPASLLWKTRQCVCWAAIRAHHGDSLVSVKEQSTSLSFSFTAGRLWQEFSSTFIPTSVRRVSIRPQEALELFDMTSVEALCSLWHWKVIFLCWIFFLIFLFIFIVYAVHHQSTSWRPLHYFQPRQVGCWPSGPHSGCMSREGLRGVASASSVTRLHQGSKLKTIHANKGFKVVFSCRINETQDPVWTAPLVKIESFQLR